jgi:hypothetical protein
MSANVGSTSILARTGVCRGGVLMRSSTLSTYTMLLLVIEIAMGACRLKMSIN